MKGWLGLKGQGFGSQGQRTSLDFWKFFFLEQDPISPIHHLETQACRPTGGC